MNYYRLHDDITKVNRWYLGDINYEDIWDFTSGRADLSGDFPAIRVRLDKQGIELDYTETDADEVPIVSKRLADQLSNFLEDIQLIPIKVESTETNYFILNVKYKVGCLDEKRSIFQKFETNDEIRPDLAGDYKAVNPLFIDPDKVNRNIFRLDKYDIVIIVSEHVKNKLEKVELSGLKFNLIS